MNIQDVNGLIFDIQSFSIHDGPGSRTSVFLSGCPLNCEWCANPEGLEFKKKILFSSQKCKNKKTNCVRCLVACPYKAIFLSGKVEETLLFNRNLCDDCTTFECTKVCYNEALRVSGEWISMDELFRNIDRDRKFWKNGGVTFTGGEPFFQKEFLLSALKVAKIKQIHTAIETSAYVDTKTFIETMKLVDFAFIDIKHMDIYKHKEKTGVNNTLILNNISSLKKSKWQGRLIIRMPVITGFNDNKLNINSLIEYMKINNLFEINILPFHRMGYSKWKQLGKDYKYKDELPTEREKLLKIQSKFLDNRIACYIGTEIVY